MPVPHYLPPSHDPFLDSENHHAAITPSEARVSQLHVLLVALASVLGLLLVHTALAGPHIPALTKALYFPL
ncbi:hypothetical protein FIBSPDRAFT_855420 [Athelia psychrophila]|uniref:Uncharacterized protein n=1 Tax=Athelia psychrophila TaxID=1759441 RepID=A0A166P754_9AGAM|nr:hypothetical protein FIBSPDRAFT_855420 [Fibularhizoctonia sp. CBS 109695]